MTHTVHPQTYWIELWQLKTDLLRGPKLQLEDHSLKRDLGTYLPQKMTSAESYYLGQIRSSVS